MPAGFIGRVSGGVLVVDGEVMPSIHVVVWLCSILILSLWLVVFFCFDQSVFVRVGEPFYSTPPLGAKAGKPALRAPTASGQLPRP